MSKRVDTPPSEAIKPGDLLQVIRPTLCCGRADVVGKIVTATDWPMRKSVRCTYCGFRQLTSPAHIKSDDGKVRERVRYKRIPPLDELEGQRTEEDIREPA